MNIFTRAAKTFQQTFVDYTIMRAIASRMTDVEYAIATSDADKQRLKEIANAPTSQMGLWTQLYEHFVNYRNDLNKYEALKEHYLVEAMVNAYAYDALAIDPQTEKSFDLTIDKQFPSSNRAQRIVDDFRYNISLDTFLNKIVCDAIFYGQYWVEYLRDKEHHIVGLKDSYQPGSIFTVGLEGLAAEPLYYCITPGNTTRISTLDSDNIACLQMQIDRMRFSLSKEQIMIQGRDSIIAQTSTVGRHFCANIYDKVFSLELLEQLYLAGIAAAMQRNTLISVKAPDGLDLQQIKSFNAYWENLINNNDSADMPAAGFSDLGAIRMFAAAASKIRVIPEQSQRGAMNVALAADQAGDTSIPDKINNLRNLITDIKGVPYSFLFSAEGRAVQPIGVSMRQYVRYARAVKMMQNGLRRFLTKVIKDLLRSYGLAVPDEFIHVSQYCAVNVAELDRMEYADATTSVIEHIYQTISTLTQDPDVQPFVNGIEKARYIESLLDSMSGATQIINVPDEKAAEQKRS